MRSAPREPIAAAQATHKKFISPGDSVMEIINNSRHSRLPRGSSAAARYASRFEHNSNIMRPVPFQSKEGMR